MRVFFGILSLCWKLYLGIVFIATAIIYYPFVLPFLFSEKGRKKSFVLFVAWSWTFRILCFYHVKKVVNSPLPKGQYIIVANHSSYLDIFLMYSLMPKQRFLFLGKSEILKYPLIKTFFRNLNIPVHRGNGVKSARALVAASQAVKKGWSLVIFPEGGIPDGVKPKMAKFKTGAFRLAKSCKIPIVPITFINNHFLFSDPTYVLGPARPGISKVYIHPYIDTDEIDRLPKDELKEKCFNIIKDPLQSHYPTLWE